MEKAVGSKVRLVRVNPATGAETSETAEVLSTVGGVVLRIGSRIEVLRDDNLPDARDLRQGAGKPARRSRRFRCSSTRRSP